MSNTAKYDKHASPETDSPGAVHFSAPFIKRPVATFLLSIAILLAGAGAYKLLPVASLPEVEFPVIAVGAALPGADPETMASSVKVETRAHRLASAATRGVGEQLWCRWQPRRWVNHITAPH